MITGTFPEGTKPAGYQQLTVSSSVVGLTVPTRAVRAIIGVQAQSIRWRDDGTDPTASVGMLQKADTFFELHGAKSMEAFEAIRVDGSDGVLNISYYA